MDSRAMGSINWSQSNVEQWVGGYKLEVDVTSDEYQSGWSYEIELEYGDRISEVYGAKIEDNGNGSYTVKGESYWTDIEPGETIRPILIVSKTETDASRSGDLPVSMTDAINSPSIRNVSADYGGNIANAIADSNAGDTVQLGNEIYYTDGLFIEKGITLQGTENSVINGNATDGSIIEFGNGADSSVIRDLTITNGNNGISGDGAEKVTLQNLNINNIGIDNPLREGNNNTGIGLSHADGLIIKDSTIENVGRKGVGLGDTVGATISGLKIEGVNLDAQHAQSHDAAGIKLFNTHGITIADNHLSKVNAMSIWNDTTSSTNITGNTIVGVGEDFAAPEFNPNVQIHGIYNEKSSNSVVTDNGGSAVDGFNLYNSTEFTTESMSLEGNDFGHAIAIGTTDYWVNEDAERAIANTIDPDAANFDLFADEYYEVAVF